MKVLMMSPWHDHIATAIKEGVPDLFTTKNYEEVLGLVKAGDVELLCIVSGGHNYSKSWCNNIDGKQAVDELHTINPALPILVWDGVYGEKPEGKKENETYLKMQDFDYDHETLYKLTIKFFSKIPDEILAIE